MRLRQENQLMEIGTARKIAAITSADDFTVKEAPDTTDELNQLGINYLDNSDFDFSKDAYINTSPAGGDIAHECFNFFRQRFIRITDAVLTDGSTALLSASNPFDASYSYPMDFFALRAGTDEIALVGTITRVSDAEATMSVSSEADITNGIVFFGDSYAESSATSLKDETHSLFTGVEDTDLNIARWDSDAGQAELGNGYDIACTLPINLATRGLDLFFSCNVKLRDTVTDTVILYAGLYDTTTGFTKFLEAANFDLEVSYTGTAGAKTYECIVVGTLNSGEKIVSDIVTVTGVADTLNADNYLQWSWEDAPRILDFALYRKDTSTGITVRVFTIYNGETRFFDRDTDGEEVTTFPEAPARREYAYAESFPFTPTAEYKRVPLRFRVPPTYDQASTTAPQILRIGCYTADERPLIIDRVMLSLTESVWNRSTRDLALIATQTPTAGNPDGNQGIGCFADGTPVIVKDSPDGVMYHLAIEKVKKGQWIWNGATFDRILRLQRKPASILYSVQLSNGIYFECSPTQKFITSRADKRGTSFGKLIEGDELLTVIDGVAETARIVKKVKVNLYENEMVNTLSLERGKLFLAGYYKGKWYNPFSWRKKHAGVVAHNAKSTDYTEIVI